jgi:hypothetical protein
MTESAAFEGRPRPVIGHNQPPEDAVGDPGPADDFADTGPIAQRAYRLNADDVDAFYHAVRTHGSEVVRQGAISRMLKKSTGTSVKLLLVEHKAAI